MSDFQGGRKTAPRRMRDAEGHICLADGDTLVATGCQACGFAPVRSSALSRCPQCHRDVCAGCRSQEERAAGTPCIHCAPGREPPDAVAQRALAWVEHTGGTGTFDGPEGSSSGTEAQP